MKAEERHRLHENDLQRLAETARFRSQPFVERYGTTILLAIAAVIIIAAVAVWWFRSRDTSDAAVWSDLGAVLRDPEATAEDFANIADSDQYAGTTAAKWARLLESEARLDSGLAMLFTDREGALRELESAQQGFEGLLDGLPVSPEHAMRVKFGLAKVLEITSDGDLQPSIDQYLEVAELYPGTVYETLATQRVAALKSPEAKEFYAWFSQQSPKPADPLQRPDDGGAMANPFGGMFSPPSGPAPAQANPTVPMDDAPAADAAPGTQSSIPSPETDAVPGADPTDEGSASPSAEAEAETNAESDSAADSSP